MDWISNLNLTQYHTVAPKPWTTLQYYVHDSSRSDISNVLAYEATTVQ